MMLIGFLHRGGIEYWTYAIAADIAIQGDRCIRFTMEDCDFARRMIHAEVWHEGRWIKRWSRFPDAIRNFELHQKDDRILDLIPYSLGPPVSKIEQSSLFSRIPALAAFIPKTLPFDRQTDLVSIIRDWGAGLLKPVRGRLGQGIIFIRTHARKFRVEQDGQAQTVTAKALLRQVAPLLDENARPYLLQQFAAGTAPCGRYYNVRIVVIKSGDGDWHPCESPMSLLAPAGTVVANRVAGARNVDLFAILRQRFPDRHRAIADHLFHAAVVITRILDDSVNGSAEEIALDMAIDDAGRIWLHEANWRGGIWLFADDIGLHRHGGANLHRIARQGRAGVSLDIRDAVLLAARTRGGQPVSGNRSPQAEAPPDLGFCVPRAGITSIELFTHAICQQVPYIAVSSLASFRASQRRLGKALEIAREQAAIGRMPLIISISGALVHDPESEHRSDRWLREQWLANHIITEEDIRSGFSLEPYFLQQAIKDQRADLGLASLPLLLIEGLEHSLLAKRQQRRRWQAAVQAMTQAIDAGRIDRWGLCLQEDTLRDQPNLMDRLACEWLPSDAIGPSALLINLTRRDEMPGSDLDGLLRQLPRLALPVMLLLPEQPVRMKPWHQPHACLPLRDLRHCLARQPDNSILLPPLVQADELRQLLALAEELRASKAHQGAAVPSSGEPPTVSPSSPTQREQRRRSLNILARLSSFDPRQYFRFFVDGRFHKSYRGWAGYEANEPGSVKGILNAYCHMLDNFDLSHGLRSAYVRELHLLCMKNVITKNLKSTPGELRYLEAGFNIYRKYSTLDSVAEILEIRRGDGTPVFHSRGYERTADELDAAEIMQALQQHGSLKFRPWYPQLSRVQRQTLPDPPNLDAFYELKHEIQRGFAKRLDGIVERYNREVARATDERDLLIAISRVTRNIEMLHPFPDGNGRLCIAILMNHLLMYHGFLPAILNDPNIDIELSVAEFAEEIQRGIANTELLLENPEAELFDYAIGQASPRELADFEALAREFTLKLSPYRDLEPAGTDQDAESYDRPYLYLTPQNLTRICDGHWVNAQPERLASLRFPGVACQPDQQPGDRRLYFCRDLSQWKRHGENPLAKLQQLQLDGFSALVLDDLELARNAPLPALYVADTDDALAAAGRAARRAISCKAIAIAGMRGKGLLRSLLDRALADQAALHVMPEDGNKTPQIMTTLANLRWTDQIIVTEVHVANRPNVSRYRSRALRPDISVFTDISWQKDLPDDERNAELQAYAALLDGMPDQGLCLLDSSLACAQDLTDALRQRRPMGIQTYGRDASDMARLDDARFDAHRQTWNIRANILGDDHVYSVSGPSELLPRLSLAALLVVATLGYDVPEAADALGEASP